MNSNNDNEKKFLTIKEFASAIGVHEQTLRTWDKEGKLKPHHVTMGGHRLYSSEQIDDYFNGNFNTTETE